MWGIAPVAWLAHVISGTSNSGLRPPSRCARPQSGATTSVAIVPPVEAQIPLLGEFSAVFWLLRPRPGLRLFVDGPARRSSRAKPCWPSRIGSWAIPSGARRLAARTS